MATSFRVRSVFANAVVLAPLVVTGLILANRGAAEPEPEPADPWLEAGAVFPTLTLESAGGVVLDGAKATAGAVVLIVHPECEYCHTMLRALSSGEVDAFGTGESGLVVVSIGDAAGTAELRAEYPGVTVYRDRDRTLVTEAGLGLVPVLVVVDGRGRVRADASEGWSGPEALRAYLSRHYGE